MKKLLLSVTLLSFVHITQTEHIATNPIGAIFQGIFNKTEEVITPEETVGSAFSKLGSALGYAGQVVGKEIYNFGALCAKQAWETTSKTTTYCARKGSQVTVYCVKQAWEGTRYTAAQTYKHVLVPAAQKTAELAKKGAIATYTHAVVPAARATKNAAVIAACYTGKKISAGAAIVKDVTVEKACEYPKTTAALITTVSAYFIIEANMRAADARLACKANRVNLQNAQITLQDRLAWAFGRTPQLNNIKIEGFWQRVYLACYGLNFTPIN